MPNNGSTAVADSEALSQALGALESGDYSARLPKGQAAITPEVVDRLNQIFEEVQRRQREAAARERDLTEELDETRESSPKQRSPSREKRYVPRALRAVEEGDFSARIESRHVDPEVAGTFNRVVRLNARRADEFERVSRLVGKEGKLFNRASIEGLKGSWSRSVVAFNTLIGDLVQPTIEVARVIGAVAKGNLTQTMPTEIEGRPVKGAFLQMAKTINTMVDQLKAFASEVTRVAREVGTDGKLGGQAEVKGVAGAWKGLTDNVNSMARNLTNQVRNIADVTTAVAKGDLSKKITVQAKGEIRQLKDTINTMVDQLNAFASEVARVAREVGTAGKLGGQAEVEGVAGAWKDLTDNVNSMASNLTNQVR